MTILGTPAEIYNYGTQYWLMVIPIFLMGIIVSVVYLPVFTALGVGSSYEVGNAKKISNQQTMHLLNFFFFIFIFSI